MRLLLALLLLASPALAAVQSWTDVVIFGGTNSSIPTRALKATITVSGSTGASRSYLASSNTDAARFTALSAAFSGVVAGESVYVSPGSYAVTSQLVFKANSEYNLGAARLYTSGTSIGSNYFFSIGVSGTGADNVIIRGGEFDGASNNVGLGGLLVDKSRNLTIIASRFHHWPQTNGALVGNSNPSTKYPANKLIGCQFENNTLGVFVIPEFFTFTECNFYANTYGAILEPGGNAIFNGCQFHTNGVGVWIKDGSNDSHARFSGCSFEHNTAHSLLLDGNVNNGVEFAATSFYADDTTHGYIELNGGSFHMIGGILDAPVTATTVPTGMNIFESVLIGGTCVSVSGLSTPERALVQFYSASNPDGTSYSQNNARPLTPAGSITLTGTTYTPRVSGTTLLWATP